MIKTSIILFVLFYLVTAHSQQTIDKLNSNQLKLPKETISKALSIDSNGQVKSSATSDVELGYLSGVTSAVQDQIDDKANDADAVHLTGDESISGVKTLTGKLVTSSTVNASIPCPVMTQTQRDAIATPSVGDCVFNSDTSLSNIYDGALWKAMGGSGGGIGLWVTANGYAVDDVVIESNNIYICLTAHTSGTFATDLAALKWEEVSPYVDTIGVNLKSQNGAPSLVQEIQVPNNQSTNTATDKFLLETGNKNILSNPSFEHSTFSTGWTNSAGTFTQELTGVIDGKASAKLVLSSQTMSLTQSSTLYASNFADGVQGIATVRIKSNVALKVCSIRAGTVSTSNCVDVPNDNKWGLFKVPFILGATSNGISIASSGAVSGTVYIDDAFVGAVDLKVDAPSINTQSSYIVQIANFTNATITGALTTSSSSGVYSYNSATGIYTALKDASVTAAFSCTTNSAVATSALIYLNAVALSSSDSVALNGYAVTGAANFSVATGDTFKFYTGGGTCANQRITVVAKNTINNSVYSSPVTINADKIGEIIQTTNSTAPQGFISALNKSIGQTGSGATYTGQTYYALYEHLWSIAGLTTTAGDVYRISSAKGASASADFAANKIITIDYETNAPFIRGKASAAGVGAYTDSDNKTHNHIQAHNVGGNAVETPQYGFSGVPNSVGGAGWKDAMTNAAPIGTLPNTSSSGGTESKPKNVSLNIFIRYAGDTQLITGQFNGLQTCTDTLACTDTFSAKISAAGVVSDENVDWINGNPTKPFTYINQIAFKAGLFTVTPNCLVSAVDVGFVIPRIETGTVSSSGITIVTIATNTGAGAAGAFNISCQKQGADYIGKTAMAVASDQNVRSIGSTNVDIQSVYFGSGATCNASCTTGTCTICNQVGGKITSVTWQATGRYYLNGIDGLKYNCTGSGIEVGGVFNTFLHVRTASTSSYAQIETSNTGANKNTGLTTVTCIGIP